MGKVRNNIKAVIILFLAIACCTLAVAWPQWQQELQAQYYTLEAPIDIKPGSCPNPLDVNAMGKLSVALLGTESFDVSQVNPETVRLEGIAPIKWSIEDVATPHLPYIGKQNAYDCGTDGADGYKDLVFHFNVLDLVVGALGDVNDGDVLLLQLTGNLKEEFGSYPFVGEDVIIIKSKKKK